MAWIDDRLWCHPKVVGLTDKAFRVHVNAIAYSSGFSTKGVLTPAQQAVVGGTPRTRTALIKTGLWDVAGENIRIHDWAEHNGKRDERKVADKARKRRTRSGQSADMSADTMRTNGGQAADKPADGRALKSEGVKSEGSDLKPRAVTEARPDEQRPTESTISELHLREVS